MGKGYVSATPDIYWSEKKITWRSVRSHWEALLGGCFRGIMVSTETYRCPDCKIVLLFYKKDGE